MANLYYEHINSELSENSTIVFLHDGLGCTKSWQNFPKKLCDSIAKQGIVYDRLGYGKSVGDLSFRQNNYLLDEAENLAIFLDYLKLKKVILYGHSDGGSIALAFAAKFPERTICFISEAAHVINEKETKIGIKQAIVAFKQGKFNKLSLWHGQKLTQVFNAWANTWLKTDFDLVSLKKILPKIKANHLLIQGKQDQYGTEKQYNTISKLTKGQTEIIVPECKHVPFLEKQSEVLNAVQNFILKYANENA